MFCLIFLLLLRFLQFEIDIADMDPCDFLNVFNVFGDLLHGFYRLIIIM